MTSPHLSRPYVLVVDHDAHRARALVSDLRRMGCYAALSTAGTDALRYVAENDPDALVIDWDLPDMPGLDLARRVKATSRTPQIILVREETDWRMLRRTMECGGDELLSRSCSTNRLLGILVRGRQARPFAEEAAPNILQPQEA